MRTVFASIAVFVLPLAFRAAPAAEPDFHVAPGASDADPGTSEKPFATVARARDEVRKLVARGLDKRVLVAIHGGTYELREPLVFGPQDSGTERFSITYAAAAGEAPVISGGRKVWGWKKGTGEVWTADTGGLEFRQLFVGGRRATRARTPNEGFLRIDGPSSQDKPFRLKFHGSDIKKEWAAAGDVEVVAMLAWSDIRMPIRQVDEAARVAVLAGNPRESNREANAQYYIENAPDGLDAPGEWRLDPKARTVSYWPRPGEDMSTVETTASVLPQLVLLEGDAAAGKPIRNLRFRGLSFRHTDWSLGPDGWYADGQAAVSVNAAFSATGAVGCSVEGCSFSRLANYAVHFGRGCKGNRIAGNEAFDLGAGGIRIGETSLRPDEADRAGGNEVADNHLHDLGAVFHSAIGVWIGQSSGNVIAHNDIHDLFYTAISVGWTWGYGPNGCRGNVVEANHLHHIGKDLLSDMGAIYTLGVQPGTVLRRNLIHDVSAFTYGGWGIYPDEGSSEIVIEENVVYRTKSAPFHQHYGRENVVRNNVFAFGKEHQLMRSRNEAHYSFFLTGNIVLWSEGELLGSQWDEPQGFLLDRNLYFRTKPGDWKFAKWSFDEWKARGQDIHSAIADPLFVDAAAFDFRLKPESPALKMGIRSLDLRDVGPRAGRVRTQGGGAGANGAPSGN